MATEDILINDGDSFVSLSALAAEQVEAELPISDNRDPVTVTLDSPSANTFAVSTAGTARLEVKNGTHPYGVLQTATGGGSNSASYYQYNVCKGTKASHIGHQIVTSATGDGNTIGNGFGVACNSPDDTNAITGEWKSFSVSIPDSPAATSYGYYAGAGSFQTDHWAFYAEDQLQSYFGGGMFTPKITGSAAPDNDASIELGANATIQGSTNTPLRINSTGDNSAIRYQGGSNPSWFVGAYAGTFNIAGGAGGNNQIIITPNDNVNIPDGLDLQTSRIVGSTDPDNDASIQLGAELLTSNHTPTQPNSIATKQTVDDKIWVGTTAEYNSIDPADIKPTTLYCLTD